MCLTSQQDWLIRRDAQVLAIDLRAFTGAAVPARARDARTDRGQFTLNDAARTEFPAVPDLPLRTRRRWPNHSARHQSLTQ